MRFQKMKAFKYYIPLFFFLRGSNFEDRRSCLIILFTLIDFLLNKHFAYIRLVFYSSEDVNTFHQVGDFFILPEKNLGTKLLLGFESWTSIYLTDTDRTKAVRFFESRHFFIEVTCFESFDLNRIQGDLLVCCLIYFNHLLDFNRGLSTLEKASSLVLKKSSKGSEFLMKIPLKPSFKLLRSRNLLVLIEVLNEIFVHSSKDKNILDSTLKKEFLKLTYNRNY